jgi:hypothetical protein
MSSEHKKEDRDTSSVTLAGAVDKIIPALHPVEPEKAQISVQGADPLYKEIRVENILKDEDGKTVHLKEGTQVNVTIETETTDKK